MQAKVSTHESVSCDDELNILLPPGSLTNTVRIPTECFMAEMRDVLLVLANSRNFPKSGTGRYRVGGTTDRSMAGFRSV